MVLDADQTDVVFPAPLLKEIEIFMGPIRQMSIPGQGTGLSDGSPITHLLHPEPRAVL